MDIYSAYLQKCVEDSIGNPFSNSLFSTVMKKRNLSIFQPRKDVSETDYQQHIKEKDRAREELTKDTLDAQEYKKNVFTMDLQAVKLCPALNASALYYSMKLKVHNFTMYNLAHEHQCSNYWWDESEGELEASMDEGTRIVIVSYQTLYSSLLLKIILQLSKRHTQMPCDSVHSKIEKVLKKKEIYLPSDYCKLTKIARQNPNPYESILMVHSDFKDYKGIIFYKSIRPGKFKGDPEVKDIRALKYDAISQNIYFNIRKFHNIIIPEKILISTKKHQIYTKQEIDLQKLKVVLPRDLKARKTTKVSNNI
ncbi:Uncharacterized protein FWK35_00021602 [Aphis craccivora]|uniref:Uncharacterized protein n=1 Tax=Aphis craccivora TaxID=307492 RepID=A0A6G0X2D7_APHCR|nr:Uncharacterized protein FWK35_00021602 [Aphis craccivora]